MALLSQASWKLVLMDVCGGLVDHRLWGKVQGYPKKGHALKLFPEKVNMRPTEFLRRYPHIFVLTGGGNVGLREASPSAHS